MDTHDTTDTLDLGVCPACGLQVAATRLWIVLPSWWVVCPRHGVLSQLTTWLDWAA